MMPFNLMNVAKADVTGQCLTHVPLSGVAIVSFGGSLGILACWNVSTLACRCNAGAGKGCGQGAAAGRSCTVQVPQPQLLPVQECCSATLRCQALLHIHFTHALELEVLI